MVSGFTDGSDSMSLNEFAQRHGLTYRGVFKMVQEGRLPVRVLRIGKLWRIPREDYARWMDGDEELPADGGSGAVRVGSLG